MIREFAAVASGSPALLAMLRCARRVNVFAGDDHAWRCRFFGVARQQDTPVAPFAALGDGLEPRADYWLCANPVTLHLQRDSFILANGQARGLSLEQAAELVGALNDQFAADGLYFFAPHASRWYLRLTHAPRLETHPLSEAIGQNVQRLLPQGDDALQWHTRVNEMQMLLHGHPVNLDLERRGDPPVNSLWLWGGGILTPGRQQAELRVWAHDPFTRGLAQSHASRSAVLPSSAADWPEGGMVPGEHLAVLDQLEQAHLRDDPHSWREALERMDRHWFAPLLEALHDGTINRLVLHLAGTHNVSSYALTRTDLRKFWRRAQPLGAYLG